MRWDEGDRVVIAYMMAVQLDGSNTRGHGLLLCTARGEIDSGIA